MNDRKIIFNKDIAKSVAEELGVSEKQVLYHIDFIVNRIRKLVTIPSITNIYLPHIGFFYYKITEMKKIWERLKKKGVLENEGERWSGMYKRLKGRMDFLEEQNVYDSKSFIRHKKGIKIHRYSLNNKMNFKQLEEWQNKEN